MGTHPPYPSLFFLTHLLQETMPAFITNLAPTTELEAVNAMLSAAGEAPLPAGTDLSTITNFEQVIALNLLRNATREVQSMGWKFNTEFGYQLVPAVGSPYDWVDNAGVHTNLNIFTQPTGLIRFTLTPIVEQQGYLFVDTVLRPSRKFTPGTLVFYDRLNNRDGFPVSERPYLWIDPVWLFDFEKMPEEARRFCAIHAARQFVQQVVGSQTLASFTDQDERLAYRNLKNAYGDSDDYNMLTNSDVSKHLGNRPRQGGWINTDTRRKGSD
jgi:Autographiviridae tail tubular protein Gp11